MIEMARRFLRQKFGSISTILTLCALALIACLPLNSGLGFGSIDTLAVLVLAAGSVSRDSASGALQMILARPIRRTDYLFGRYAGALAALGLFLCGTIVLAMVLNVGIGHFTTPTSHELSLSAAVLAAGHAFFAGALLVAALLFFSTFLRGWGDVLAVTLLLLVLNSLEGLGRWLNSPALSRAGALARENLAPSVPWETVLRGQNMMGEPIGRYAFALVLYGTLAACVFSRREFSYGQD